MNYKKVSLILTTYNCKNNLEKTLKIIDFGKSAFGTFLV